MDPYTVLGVRPGASDPEILDAYRRLVRTTHQHDTSGSAYNDRDRALSQMTLVNIAFQTLTRPQVERDESVDLRLWWCGTTSRLAHWWRRLTEPTPDRPNTLRLLADAGTQDPGDRRDDHAVDP
jgi:hypothetical protein